MSLENWIFFGVNLAFTVFNARMAWLGWRRQVASDYPVVTVTLARRAAGEPLVLELFMTSTSRFRWRASTAELVKSRDGGIVYPLDTLTRNRLGEMLPDPALGAPAHKVRLSVTVAADGRTYREELHVFPGQSSQIQIDLTFESDAPSPRRYIVQVKRQVPPFIAARTILPQKNQSIL